MVRGKSMHVGEIIAFVITGSLLRQLKAQQWHDELARL